MKPKRKNGPIIRKSLEEINEEHEMAFEKSTAYKIKDFGEFSISGVADGADHQAKTLVKIRTLKQGKKRINKYHEWVQMMALMTVFECEKCLIVDTDPDAKRPADWVEFDQKNFTLI